MGRPARRRPPGSPAPRRAAQTRPLPAADHRRGGLYPVRARRGQPVLPAGLGQVRAGQSHRDQQQAFRPLGRGVRRRRGRRRDDRQPEYAQVPAVPAGTRVRMSAGQRFLNRNAATSLKSANLIRIPGVTRVIFRSVADSSSRLLSVVQLPGAGEPRDPVALAAAEPGLAGIVTLQRRKAAQISEGGEEGFFLDTIAEYQWARDAAGLAQATLDGLVKPVIEVCEHYGLAPWRLAPRHVGKYLAREGKRAGATVRRNKKTERRLLRLPRAAVWGGDPPPLRPGGRVTGRPVQPAPAPRRLRPAGPALAAGPAGVLRPLARLARRCPQAGDRPPRLRDGQAHLPLRRPGRRALRRPDRRPALGVWAVGPVAGQRQGRPRIRAPPAGGLHVRGRPGAAVVVDRGRPWRLLRRPGASRRPAIPLRAHPAGRVGAECGDAGDRGHAADVPEGPAVRRRPVPDRAGRPPASPSPPPRRGDPQLRAGHDALGGAEAAWPRPAHYYGFLPGHCPCRPGNGQPGRRRPGSAATHDRQGEPAMKWNLRWAAARRDIWRPADLLKAFEDVEFTPSLSKAAALWSGKPIPVRLDDLDKICAALNCTVADLLEAEPLAGTGNGQQQRAAGAGGQPRGPVLLSPRPGGSRPSLPPN